jgi:hypothetical protein
MARALPRNSFQVRWKPSFQQVGRSATAREWAKVPADYFANLDHYRHGAPKKK